LAKTQAELVHKPGLQVVMMGFSMGGYVAAAFAATHPDLVAGLVMGACAHDTHTTTWKLVGYMSQAVYAVCSPKTKSQVSYPAQHGQSNTVKLLEALWAFNCLHKLCCYYAI
jgi:pimeloyl-ACP methyl ester carboxylesterase